VSSSRYLTFGVRLPVGTTGRPQLSPSVHRDAAVAQARRLTALADILGFDYVFSGGDAGLSSETTLALISAARRLTVVAPISVAAWHPALLARFGAVAARLSQGRFAIDLRSGPHPDDHRVDEFARIVRGLWSGRSVDVDGDHFRVRGLRPSVLPDVAPEIVVSGAWRAAPSLAARAGDWLLQTAAGVGGGPGPDGPGAGVAADGRAAGAAAEGLAARVAALEGESAAAGRTVGFALEVAVDGLLDAPDDVARRLVAYGRSGVGLLVLDLPDPEVDLPVFAREIIPRVRELERASALVSLH